MIDIEMTKAALKHHYPGHDCNDCPLSGNDDCLRILLNHVDWIIEAQEELIDEIRETVSELYEDDAEGTAKEVAHFLMNLIDQIAIRTGLKDDPSKTETNVCPCRACKKSKAYCDICEDYKAWESGKEDE